MLIVSKFHDYYDTASAYGIDKTCVYNREELIVKPKRDTQGSWRRLVLPGPTKGIRVEMPPIYERFTVRNVEYTVVKRILGFCGEIYPVVSINKRIINGLPSEDYSFYSPEAVQKFFEAEGVVFSKRRWYWERDYKIGSENGLKNFFDRNSWFHLLDVFQEFRVPSFLWGYQNYGNDDVLVLNPSLKKIRFMSVKDPQSAFQSIYMYLSGVLGAPPPPKEKMSDEVLAAAKGHDGPYSFRKPPGKRGKNRWR